MSSLNMQCAHEHLQETQRIKHGVLQPHLVAFYGKQENNSWDQKHQSDKVQNKQS